VSLGRRLRALKLWFVLRYFGSDGIAERLREHCRLAKEFSRRVEQEEGWELVAPVPFSTVAFRYAAPHVEVEGDSQDRVNLAMLDRVNESGEVFLSHARLGGRIALRLSVGNLRTKEHDVMRAWELLRDSAESVTDDEARGAGV